jgi:hypothetical protein
MIKIMISALLFSVPFYADDSVPQKWGELQCVWGCSFKSCENVRILRRCSDNCDDKYLKKCMSVAKNSFGDDLLKIVLKKNLMPAAEKNEAKEES